MSKTDIKKGGSFFDGLSDDDIEDVDLTGLDDEYDTGAADLEKYGTFYFIAGSRDLRKTLKGVPGPFENRVSKEEEDRYLEEIYGKLLYRDFRHFMRVIENFDSYSDVYFTIKYDTKLDSEDSLQIFEIDEFFKDKAYLDIDKIRESCYKSTAQQIYYINYSVQFIFDQRTNFARFSREWGNYINQYQRSGGCMSTVEFDDNDMNEIFSVAWLSNELWSGIKYVYNTVKYDGKEDDVEMETVRQQWRRTYNDNSSLVQYLIWLDENPGKSLNGYEIKPFGIYDTGERKYDNGVYVFLDIKKTENTEEKMTFREMCEVLRDSLCERLSKYAKNRKEFLSRNIFFGVRSPENFSLSDDAEETKPQRSMTLFAVDDDSHQSYFLFIIDGVYIYQHRKNGRFIPAPYVSSGENMWKEIIEHKSTINGK